MWKMPFEHARTAAFYFAFTVVHLIGEGSLVKVLCLPGEQVTLPCVHHYDNNPSSQLSVQWRSPHNELLCHYIKHKAFKNCTSGYAISNTPSSITLTIQQVQMEDFGTHVCSVSKPHYFSDYSIELVMVTRPVTTAPQSGWRHSDFQNCQIDGTILMLAYSASTLSMGKLNLTSNQYDSRVISTASPDFSYSYSSSQNMDFAADEKGLWVMYASDESKGKIVIAKVDEKGFGIENVWNTAAFKQMASNSFMACEVMYATRSVDLNTEEIYYAFDTDGYYVSYHVKFNME